MQHNECDKVLSAIIAEPWAILPESLTSIIGIASRTVADRELAMAIRDSRGGDLDPRRARCATIIPVLGPIFPHAQAFQYVSGATSIDKLTMQLRYALADQDVDHIILNIDSPGGQVTGVHEFARLVRSSCAVKPITAYVSGMAASAAYWIACAADSIVADRTAKVGSIGVITAWTDDSAARKAQGLRDYVIVSSQSPKKYLDPKSSAGRREIQEQLDAMAEIFIGEVADFRGVAAATVEESFGKGAVFLADPAMTLGMIDKINVLDAVLASGPTGRRSHSHMEDNAMLDVNGKPVLAGKPASRATRTNDDDEDTPATTTPDDEDDDDSPAASVALDDESEDDDEDEDEGEEKPSAKKARAMKAKAPDVWQAAFSAGIAAERARIQEIRELGLVGHKKLVEKAMFTSPMSAANLAMAYAKAEGRSRQAILDGRLEESKSANVASAAILPGNSTSTAAEEQALINAMAGGICPGLA